MTRIVMRAISLLVAALLLTGGVQAQSPLQRRISVTYQGEAPASVFKAFADVLGYRLRLDGTVGGTVTLDVRNVSVETALRAVCESIGCRWRIDSGMLVVDRDADAVVPGPSDPLARISVRDVTRTCPSISSGMPLRRTPPSRHWPGCSAPSPESTRRWWTGASR